MRVLSLTAFAAMAVVLHAVRVAVADRPKWKLVVPEPLRVRGATPSGSGLALDPGHVAFRVEPNGADTKGAGTVEIHRKSPSVVAPPEGGPSGTGPANKTWAFLQRIGAPEEAAPGFPFGETLCLGRSRMAATFTHAHQGTLGIALYAQATPESLWALQTVLMGDPEEGALSIGGPGLMSMTESGSMLVAVRQGPMSREPAGPPGVTPAPSPGRRLLQDAAEQQGALAHIVVYALRDGNWSLESAIPVPRELRAEGVAVSPGGDWIAVCGKMGPEMDATVQILRSSPQTSSDDPWQQAAALQVDSNFAVSSHVSIAIAKGVMAVGAGSVVTMFAEDGSNSWQEEDVLEFPSVTATGYTMGLGDNLLVVGTATAVSVHMRQAAAWPEAFQLQLASAPPVGSLPAQVAQAGMEIVVAAKPVSRTGVTVTYFNANSAFPDKDLMDNAENPVQLLLRMTGITIDELYDNRTQFLREAIANVSFADETHYDQVDLAFKQYWQSVFAQVNMTIPEGYDRLTASYDLFNGVRFGELNRILISKDSFFATVKFDATGLGGFNPFILPPEPTPEPEPTFPPSPLILSIDSNSTNATNQFIVTAKESFDQNPPERTNKSVISYAAIAGGVVTGLACFIIACRQVVMSTMLKRDVQRDTEWQYDPYRKAKPKFSAVAKARMAIAKMEEEVTYRKYYSLDDDDDQSRKRIAMKNVGKAAVAMNAFLQAKPPKDSKITAVEKLQEQTKNLQMMLRGAEAFQQAGNMRKRGETALDDTAASAQTRQEEDGIHGGLELYDDGQLSAASLELELADVS